jgi:hypothetical protein
MLWNTSVHALPSVLRITVIDTKKSPVLLQLIYSAGMRQIVSKMHKPIIWYIQ